MKAAMGRSAVATVLITTFVVANLLLLAPTVFGLAPEPPKIFLVANPSVQDAPAGGSASFDVIVYPGGDWKSGDVALAVENPPQGVTVTFNPEEMTDVQLEGFTSKATVSVAAGTPEGKVTLEVRGAGTGYSNAGGPPTDLFASTDLTVNIVASTVKTNTTTTSTTTTNTTTTVDSVSTVTSVVTSTVTTTTISTQTIVNTERVEPQPTAIEEGTGVDSGYLMFGIGALAVSSVLFISGVLLLASNRKR
jgi:hypothetical protein